MHKETFTTQMPVYPVAVYESRFYTSALVRSHCTPTSNLVHRGKLSKVNSRTGKHGQGWAYLFIYDYLTLFAARACGMCCMWQAKLVTRGDFHSIVEQVRSTRSSHLRKLQSRCCSYQLGISECRVVLDNRKALLQLLDIAI